MNDYEATKFFDDLGSRVPDRHPNMPDLVSLGKVAQARRNRRFLTVAAACSALLLAGSWAFGHALATQEGEEAKPSENNEATSPFFLPCGKGEELYRNTQSSVTYHAGIEDALRQFVPVSDISAVVVEMRTERAATVLHMGQSGRSIPDDVLAVVELQRQPAQGWFVHTVTVCPDPGLKYDASKERLATKNFPVNSHGQTYGSDAAAETPRDAPDLIGVIGDSGIAGFVLKGDLYGGGGPNNPGPSVLNVYDSEAAQVIDTFTLVEPNVPESE